MQGAASAQQTDREIIDLLLQRLADSERRIQALEAKLTPAPAAIPAAGYPGSGRVGRPARSRREASPISADPAPVQDAEMGGHSMEIAGGPVLSIKGFFDFNFGVGSIANPLIFPITSNGCGTCGYPPSRRPTPTFQAGEFDLFHLIQTV